MGWGTKQDQIYMDLWVNILGHKLLERWEDHGGFEIDDIGACFFYVHGPRRPQLVDVTICLLLIGSCFQIVDFALKVK